MFNLGKGGLSKRKLNFLGGSETPLTSKRVSEILSNRKYANKLSVAILKHKSTGIGTFEIPEVEESK